MGACGSCESRHVATSTAKVVLADGTLQEYPYPVKACCVLEKQPSSIFICNSDDMEFNGVVRAVGGDHVLQPGQLYFALPLSSLNCPLQPHQMAQLAVRATSALTDQSVPIFSGERQVVPPRRSGCGKGHKFTAMLSAIAE